jgi:RNA 3'-terminal phosphate cyclase
VLEEKRRREEAARREKERLERELEEQEMQEARQLLEQARKKGKGGAVVSRMQYWCCCWGWCALCGRGLWCSCAVG